MFIAGNEDIRQAGFQDEVQQIVSRGGECPAILGVMRHDQAVCLCNLLESLVVVGVVPGGVLDVVQIAVEMYHLMEQRGGDFLNGPCQCSGTQVDLMGITGSGNPGIIPEGEVSIGFGRTLDGDGGP